VEDNSEVDGVKPVLGWDSKSAKQDGKDTRGKLCVWLCTCGYVYVLRGVCVWVY
jgi:hypothetical protein